MIKTVKMVSITRLRRFFSLVLVAVAAIGMLLAMRPLPDTKAVVIPQKHKESESSTIAWPGYGQAAIGTAEEGVLAVNGRQKPVPIASITKLVTALTILNTHRLNPGEEGPIITLGAHDVQLYVDYLARGGSVVPVREGEKISLHQALQALLLPSANNMADTLAEWSYGSLDKYSAAANTFLKDLGLNQTKVAGASGFSAESTSTAEDLVKLGQAVLNHPVLAAIVHEQQADLPVAGTVNNTNWLLGRSGIIGIKTGNTDEAGGCYLFAATHKVEGRDTLIIGSVLGAPTLYQAMIDGRHLLESAKSQLYLASAVVKNHPYAYYQSPWGQTTTVVADTTIKLVALRPSSPELSLNLIKLNGAQPKGTKVGSINVKYGDREFKSGAILGSDILPPTPAWRVFR